MSNTYHVFIGTVKINYKRTQVLDIEILGAGCWLGAKEPGVPISSPLKGELRSASSRVELTGFPGGHRDGLLWRPGARKKDDLGLINHQITSRAGTFVTMTYIELWIVGRG